MSDEIQDPTLEYDTVEANGDGTYTVHLCKPITMGSGPSERLIEKVKSHEPTGADLKAGDRAKGDVGRAQAMIASLFDLSLGAVERMHAYDVNVLGHVVGYVMGKRPANGCG